MRSRLAAVLAIAIAVSVGWGIFIYRPALNAISACTPNGPLACSTIDGFPIGRLVEDCPCSDAADFEPVAVAGLDSRDAGHSAIAHTTVFGLDDRKVCGQELCTRSDQYLVFVFELQDRSTRAIGVECGVSGCFAHLTYP